MSIRTQLNKIMKPFLYAGDIPCRYIEEGRLDETLFEFFNSMNIIYTISYDYMFDSCVFDCWSYSIVWVENGKPKIEVYRVVHMIDMI